MANRGGLSNILVALRLPKLHPSLDVGLGQGQALSLTRHCISSFLPPPSSPPLYGEWNTEYGSCKPGTAPYYHLSLAAFHLQDRSPH